MFDPIEEGTMKVKGQQLAYRIITGGYGGGFNGYIAFPKRPVRELGYEGILAYVPVHGGITYAEQKEDGSMEYGFDTAHSHSDQFPRTDVSWIKEQLRELAEGIMRAAEVEDKYLSCKTNKGRAKHCDYVQGDGTELGFGAMINLLSGKL